MGNLFGHKRWYEVRDKENYKVRRKVKIKRNYDGNKYILNINENSNKEKINNNEFIREFVNYKKNDKSILHLPKTDGIINKEVIDKISEKISSNMKSTKEIESKSKE